MPEVKDSPSLPGGSKKDEESKKDELMSPAEGSIPTESVGAAMSASVGRCHMS